MNIQSAIFSIPARELTRRVVWLAAYLVSAHGGCVHGDAAVVISSKAVADGAVEGYDKKFPQQQ